MDGRRLDGVGKRRRSAGARYARPLRTASLRSPSSRDSSSSGQSLAADESLLIDEVSHVLRTPLTTVYGGAELLQRGAARGRVEPEIAEAVWVEAERLYRAVEDLLALVRTSQDRELLHEPVLLQRVVPDLVAHESARHPGRVFRTLLPPETPPVAGDEAALAHALRNLLANAARMAPSGSPIELTLRTDGGAVEIRVLDRGPEIDASDAATFFEPFPHASAATDTRTSGAGLGLAAARALVEAMNGRAWAGARPGGGAEVGLALPLYDIDADR